MMDNNKPIANFTIVKNFITNIHGLIQYRFATSKNYYSCVFIGEKLNVNESYNTIILYRMKGKKEILEIPIKTLLDDINLLRQFHQKDAAKFGAIAMGDILFQENNDFIKQRFENIKRKMLDTTQSPNEPMLGQNYCPCKFAGEKPNVKKPYNTSVLYTIKGKREVFEIPIKELLEDTALLEKFDQTVAIKLGAIAMGDSLFANNQNARRG
ncbi:MAG: hypothetical protein ABI597_07255 [Gammaproteobacteria bacterium]